MSRSTAVALKETSKSHSLTNRVENCRRNAVAARPEVDSMGLWKVSGTLIISEEQACACNTTGVSPTR